MAQMIPNQCPPETASEAEKVLFKALKERLDDHYTVIHSLPWLDERSRRLKEGECDFLVLHPQHGFLALETKSGELRYDGPNKAWFRKDGKPVKDPFWQAEGNAHFSSEPLAAVYGAGG